MRIHWAYGEETCVRPPLRNKEEKSKEQGRWSCVSYLPESWGRLVTLCPIKDISGRSSDACVAQGQLGSVLGTHRIYPQAQSGVSLSMEPGVSPECHWFGTSIYTDTQRHSAWWPLHASLHLADLWSGTSSFGWVRSTEQKFSGQVADLTLGTACSPV